MPEDQYWNRVLGMTDFIARDILRTRERNRQIAERRQELREDREFRAQQATLADERRMKSQQWTNKMQALGKMMDTKGLTDESRNMLMGSMAKMTTDPDVELPTRGVQTHRRHLIPEVAEMFKGVIDVSQPLPLSVAESIEKQAMDFMQERTRERDATSRERQAGAAEERARKYQSGSSRETPKANAKALLSEFRRSMENVGEGLEPLKAKYRQQLDKWAKEIHTGADPDSMAGEMFSFGEFQEKMEKEEEESQAFDQGMETLMDEIRGIRKESKRFK